MFWAVVGAALGAASEDTESGNGGELAISILAVALLVYVWSMYFYLKRQQAKRRQPTSRNRP